MAEETVQTSQSEKKIVSVGAPQLVKRSVVETPSDPAQATAASTAQSEVDASAGAAGAAGAGDVTPPTEEQMKKFFQSQGIEFNSFDDLKNKLTTKKEPAPLTDDQKAEIERKKDERRLQIYLKGNGTIEQYAAITAVANKNLKELSQQEALREFTKAGFSEEEAKTLIKERYYQLTEDEIDMYDDESKKDFVKRKAAYFTEKLANKASHLQNDAKKILQGLDSVIDAEETQKQKEEAISSKVEEHFSKLPREMTFELGKVDDQDIDPIKYKVDEAEISSIVDVLKDPEKRKKFLYTEDGSLNIPAISDALIKSAVLQSAVKVALLEGGDRQTKTLQKVFPNSNPHAIGVGGSTTSGSAGKVAGKLVSVGKSQVVRPVTHN